MDIEIEYPTHTRRFTKLRDNLITKGSAFDASSLKEVPYSELHLCCIGNAGTAICSPSLVQQEKSLRRQRFLHLEPEEFKEAETYLMVEQMYEDVLDEIVRRNAPKWADLSPRQQVLFELACLYNHLDNPRPRLNQVVAHLLECVVDPQSGLPSDVCRVYAGKLKGLAYIKGRLNEDALRTRIMEASDTLFEYLEEDEKRVFEKEQLSGFSCTSDCFKIL